MRYEVKVRFFGDHPQTGWHVTSVRSKEAAEALVERWAVRGGRLANRHYRREDIEKVWYDEDRSRVP